MSFAPAPRDRFAKFSTPSSKRPGLFFWIPVVVWSGLTAVGSLALQQPQAIAEAAPFAQPQPGTGTAKVLLVNPTSGNDAADGSDRAPFKTITQALQAAQPNTIIQLAPGTYSEATGEKFPLSLKPGITLQGNSQSRGSDTLIQGGGFMLSPTFARQNVTIVGASKAVLIGVTVTNSSPQGYGLWIESTSLTVTDNTFIASGHDGISVTGNSAPLIRNNYFSQNSANGITVYGTSRPEIRENVFEQNGFAINLNQNSAPLIIGNRITQNKDGIVAQANSHPTLRNNSIEGNQQDGVVAIAQSRPDLGTATEPGGNFIRNNGQFDINAQASSQAIPAFGNELDQTLGQLDLAGTGAGTNTGTSAGISSGSASVADSTPAANSLPSTPAANSLPTVAIAATSPSRPPKPTASAASIKHAESVEPAIVSPKPTLASASKPTTSTISFGERLAASSPADKSVAPPLPTSATPAPQPDVLPSSSFPVPTTLSGIPEASQLHRPIQLVRLVSFEAGGRGVGDTGTRGRGDAGTSASVSLSPRLPFSASLRLPSTASPSSQGKPPNDTPAFPVPSLLTTVTSDRIALVPNSPPISLALPVSEASRNLALDPEKNQAAALGTTPVQIQLSNFAKTTPAIVPSTAHEKPKVTPAIAPPINSNKPLPPTAYPVAAIASPIPSEKPLSSPAKNDSKAPDSGRAIEIPVPAPESRFVSVTPPVALPPVALPSVALPPKAPPPPSVSADRTDALSLLPVPDSNAPIGNAGSLSKASFGSSKGQGDSSGPPAPPNRGDLVGVRYRVLVEAENDSQQAQIRTLVPNAFPTSLQGRNVMQVGAFGDRLKADQLVQSLITQGLKAMVEPTE